jgi:ATP-dependent Lon protease
LVSDFLSECWDRLRAESRIDALQNRVQFGGALSGRDLRSAQKTVSGLLKLISPDGGEPVNDDDLEWAVRLGLECRRRVKEQQKRIGSAEFRNTHFSYVMGETGVEKFVVTPELQSEETIGDDPLPPGQVWVLSPGGLDEGAGLYRIDVNTGPGSGVHILNRPAPQAFVESMRYGEQNLYARSQTLVGDRDPRAHEFSVQLRAFDTARSGEGLGLGALLALCSALLQKSLKGGLVTVGSLNLGGTIDPVYNPVSLVELAVEKGANTILMPVSARKQLFDLSDDMATKITTQFYTDAREALIKALGD